MSEPRPIDDAPTFERLAREQFPPAQYVLRLYVAGTTPNSSHALRAVRKFCDTHLAGRYDLEVIDIYQQPVLAEGDQIVAVPTLLKRLPLPLRRFIGDLSNEERLLVGLDLKPKRPD